MKPHGWTPKPRRRRWLWFVVPFASLVVAVVLAVVFIDLLVTYATQKGLDRLESAAGSFKKLHVTLKKPGYEVYELKITQMPASNHPEPLFFAEKIDMSWSWRELFHGKLVRRIDIDKARIMVPMRPGENGKPSQPPLEIAKTLESVPSAGLERLALRHSQVIVVDEHHNGQRIWLHDLDVTVENVASRKDLMKGLPLLVTMRGRLQRSGDLTVFMSMDPFDKGLTFAGSAELKHIKLADLYDFTKIKGLSITNGSMDVFASVTCKRGALNGGVKPILTNVHVEAADGKIGDKIKAALADIGVKILSDRVPGRNAVATLIPIHGTLSQPNVQLVPTVLAVIRNAFVEGLAASLSDTPPPVAGKDKGLIAQTVQALTKSSPKPIEAQPKDKK